ncbi:MAG: glycerate kinase [Victivallales bacterium]|nr:glycerate kinase [Victivallales bacterium]
MRNPRIVIAPDSFKGTLSAKNVCTVWQDAFKNCFPEAELTLVPMSDGGDGALEAILDATNADVGGISAEDPLGRPVKAFFALLNGHRTAFIETAAACGIVFLKREERNPMIASSFGAGQLIAKALESDVEEIIVSIGGSATVDGGVGMLQALGYRFLDANGAEIGRGGAELHRIATIDASNANPALARTKFGIASDVTNPLLGPDGAATVFGPQKGATPEMVAELEAGLAHFAEVCAKCGIASDCCHDGDGAAGGMGFALRAFLGAEMRPGAALIAELIGLEDVIKNADVVITGEGRTDRQTLFGKLPAFVADLAAKHSVPTILCSGAVEDKAELLNRFYAVFDTVPSVVSLESALENARGNLSDTACAIVQLLKLRFGDLK